MMRIRLNKKGFTLIELLIVVAIIGIIAAIAIPNLLNAIQRGKQKRSMADIRAVGTAVEAYAVDTNLYPSGASPVSAIQTFVEPKYIKTLPLLDAWDATFEYASDNQSYTLASGGKDTSLNGGGTPDSYTGPTTSFNNDIVFTQGQFIAFPEGAQQ
jgi:type II secretion system protein G